MVKLFPKLSEFTRKYEYLPEQKIKAEEQNVEYEKGSRQHACDGAINIYQLLVRVKEGGPGSKAEKKADDHSSPCEK